MVPSSLKTIQYVSGFHISSVDRADGCWVDIVIFISPASDTEEEPQRATLAIDKRHPSVGAGHAVGEKKTILTPVILTDAHLGIASVAIRLECNYQIVQPLQVLQGIVRAAVAHLLANGEGGFALGASGEGKAKPHQTKRKTHGLFQCWGCMFHLKGGLMVIVSFVYTT